MATGRGGKPERVVLETATEAVGAGGVAVPPLPASCAFESCAFESHCGLVPHWDCGPLRGGVADRGRRESELEPRLDGMRLQAGLDRRLGKPACNARSMSAFTALRGTSLLG